MLMLDMSRSLKNADLRDTRLDKGHVDIPRDQIERLADSQYHLEGPKILYPFVDANGEPNRRRGSALSEARSSDQSSPDRGQLSK